MEHCTWINIKALIVCNMEGADEHLLDMSEPSTISESSMRDTTSAVSAPFRSSSPRVLNEAKARLCRLQSATTYIHVCMIKFCQVPEQPVQINLLQLGLDVFFLYSCNADILNIIFVLQERGLHDVSQLEVL